MNLLCCLLILKLFLYYPNWYPLSGPFREYYFLKPHYYKRYNFCLLFYSCVNICFLAYGSFAREKATVNFITLGGLLVSCAYLNYTDPEANDPAYYLLSHPLHENLTTSHVKVFSSIFTYNWPLKLLHPVCWDVSIVGSCLFNSTSPWYYADL